MTYLLDTVFSLFRRPAPISWYHKRIYDQSTIAEIFSSISLMVFENACLQRNQKIDISPTGSDLQRVGLPSDSE